MRTCKHSQWLDLSQDDRSGLTLSVTPRLDVLVDELPFPAEQKPTLWLLLGHKSKAVALKAMVPSIRSQDVGPSLHLHVDPLTTRQVDAREGPSHPIFIVDGQLSTDKKVGATVHACHPTSRKHLQVTDHAGQLSASHFLCSHIILPFADVVTVFLADYPDLDFVVDEVGTWMDATHGSSRPGSTLPHLVLVSERDRKVTAQHFLQQLGQRTTKPWNGIFANVSEVVLECSELSATSRHRVLKETLLNESDAVRNARLERRYLLSARHLQEMVHHRFVQLELHGPRSFDFIHWSRRYHPVADDLTHHLTNLLAGYGAINNVLTSATSMIASALLMDHYLPDMHHFNPTEVFDTLFRRQCDRALATRCATMKKGKDRVVKRTLMTRLRRNFVEQHRRLEDGSDPSAFDIHIRNVERFRGHWARAFSAVTCLLCVRRIPDGPRLSCGHRLCRVCIQVAGKSTTADPWSFRFPANQCPLCASRLTAATIGFRPPSAGVRVLSVDGGGTRAVAPLEVLSLMERCTQVPHLTTRAFDFAIGSSAAAVNRVCIRGGNSLTVGGLTGALVSTPHLFKGWSAARCLQEFERLARVTFQPPIPFQWARFLLSYCYGGLYPSEPISDSLRQVFGDATTIDDCSWATRYGIQLAVTASGVPGNSCYIFNNYNGGNLSAERGGYEAIRMPSKDIPIWEMLRSTTAAPGYFTPHYIDALRKTFQDGAMCRNNPVGIADCEARRSGDAIAYIITLGTGTATSTVLPCPRGRYLGRLWDLVVEHMNSDRQHQEFKQNRPELQRNGRLHRFDLDFHGDDVALDAVDEMPRIRRLARDRYEGSPELTAAVDAMVAEMFYFELSRRPEGVIRQTVWGQVSCRWKAPHEGYASWRHYLRGRQIRVVVQHTDVIDMGEDSHNNLACPFVTEAEGPHSTISVQIQVDRAPPRHLAGSPFPLPYLLEAHGLHTHMGVPHQAGTKRPATDAMAGPSLKRTRTQLARPRRGPARRAKSEVSRQQYCNRS